ncbi:MAG: LLM class flavin-dependent oxidoreductase [Candidatus Ranarchaeia archaeon]
MPDLSIANLNIDPIMDLIPFAKEADQAGFNSIWLPDNSPSTTFRDVFVALTAVALNTKQIHFGPGICPIYTRHPVYLAVAATALQELSQGRFILGVGPGGNMTLAPFDVPIWDKPLRYVREAVELIDKLQKGEVVTWNNPYFKCKNVRLQPQPNPRVPIYLSARGPKMTRLCGRIADGVLLSSPAAAVGFSVNLIKDGAKKAGRPLSDIKIVDWVMAYIGKEIDERSMGRIKADLGFQIANTVDQIHELCGIDLEDVQKVREALNSKGPEESRKYITQEMIDTYTVVGSTDDCIEILMKYYKQGVDEMIIADPLGKNPIETIRLVGKEIIPHITKQ